MDYREIRVSMFKSVNDVSGREISLLQWLEGSTRLNQLVDAIRSESDKPQRDQLKRSLPAITPSGIFSQRKAAALVKHSGLIALDFDQVADIEATKQTLKQIENVFFAALSVSGRGLWALIPIAEPEHHKKHFDALRLDCLRLGLIVDKACSDVSRLRFYSYDLEPWINFDAITYTKKATSTPPPAVAQYKPTGTSDPIKTAVEMIQQAPTGERHNHLLRAARLLGGYVAAGKVDEFEAIQALETAIQQKEIESFANARKTIADGLRYGKQTPIF